MASERPQRPGRPSQRGIMEEDVRAVAREEIASFAGLVLRRLQNVSTSYVEGSEAVIQVRDLNAIFGEALRDFGATPEEPGQ